MSLLIGKNGFTLPLELIVSRQAILAQSGFGKSYTASVEAEEMLRNGQQIAVIDPTGAWWGLRSSVSGDGPGYSIIVFGGRHADAELEPSAGRALAAALVEHGFSAIFDLSEMETEDQVRFGADFTGELLRINQYAMHLFLDEAEVFAPQSINLAGQKISLGRVSRLVKQGRIKGIGVTMISQRASSISKDILSQVSTLVVLRLSWPSDIEAATDWMAKKVSPEFAKSVAVAVPTLPVGTAFVCSLGIAERIEIRERTTYDSGATPVPGERKSEPTVLAAIDIENLGRTVAESAKRLEENSPEYLRKRITDLERAAPAPGAGRSTVETGALKREIGQLRLALQEASAREKQLRQENLQQTSMLDAVRQALDTAPAAVLQNSAKALGGAHRARQTTPGELSKPKPSASPTKRPARQKPVESAVLPAAGALASREQTLLDTLVRLEAFGFAKPSKRHLAAFSGYASLSSGSFTTPVAALARRGLLSSDRGLVSLTGDGRARARPWERPTSEEELQAQVFALLSAGERRLMQVLLTALPHGMSRSRLAADSGYAGTSSGSFTMPLAKLLKMGFADAVDRGVVRANRVLFPDKTAVAVKAITGAAPKKVRQMQHHFHHPEHPDGRGKQAGLFMEGAG